MTPASALARRAHRGDESDPAIGVFDRAERERMDMASAILLERVNMSLRQIERETGWKP